MAIIFLIAYWLFLDFIMCYNKCKYLSIIGGVFMRLLLHLSDLHISSTTKEIDDEAKRISNALESFCREKKDIKQIIIVVSGDLTWSGKKEEFDLFDKFIGKLRYHINTKLGLKPYVLTCPGNHDIDFPKELTRDELVNMTSDEKYSFYIPALKNYFESNFANNWQNNFVLQQNCTQNGETFHFCILNSVIGSRIEDIDTDKGIHSIPNRIIKNISLNNDNLNILVLHHSIEWFSDDQWEYLNSLIDEYFDLVLYGHEHNNRDFYVKSKKRNVDFICSGPLFIEDSSFNIITIDNKQINTYKATKTNAYYDIIECNKFFVDERGSKDEIFYQDYLNGLSEYSLIPDAKVSDIFVFPQLSYVDNENMLRKVDSIDDFVKHLSNKNYKYFMFEGDEFSGKTELMNYLFLYLRDKYYPLLLNPHDVVNNVDKTFKNIFRKSYDTRAISFNQYHQLDIKEKILIIDDFDFIPLDARKKIINYASINFSKILIVKKSQNINFVSNVIENISSDETMKLSISPMLYRKREELIFNVCKFNYKYKDDLELRNLSKAINESISKQLTILNLTPQFIILCVNALIKNDYQLNSTNGFTAVFQSNITRLLESVPEIDIEKYLYLLQLISYEAHVSKEYPISFGKISEVISEYNLKGSKTRKAIVVVDFVNNLERCKLIKKSREDVNKYTFISPNYFSYFIAKNIVSLIAKNETDVLPVLEKLVREISFGLNGDILLYVSYILQTSKIIDMIHEISKDFFNDFTEEINLNPKDSNVQYLFLNQSNLILQIPSKVDKENNLRKREEDENKIEKSKKQNIEYYGEKEVDFDNSIVRIKIGIKYIEILAKLLPDFIHLDSLDCEQIIKNLFSYCNKILYYILKPYEELFDENSEILKELYSDSDIREEFKNPLMIKAEIQKISNIFILNMYNMVARLSSSDSTIYAFDNLADKTKVTNELLNLMQHEHIEHLESFGAMFEDIDKKYDNITIRNYLKIILRKHILTNSIKYYGNNQRIINTYLNSSPKKSQVARIRTSKKR